MGELVGLYLEEGDLSPDSSDVHDVIDKSDLYADIYDAAMDDAHTRAWEQVLQYDVTLPESTQRRLAKEDWRIYTGQSGIANQLDKADFESIQQNYLREHTKELDRSQRSYLVYMAYDMPGEDIDHEYGQAIQVALPSYYGDSYDFNVDDFADQVKKQPKTFEQFVEHAWTT